MAPSVIFVCLGNINRSAVAEGILRKHRPDVKVKSAATGGWHAGEGASAEMTAAAKQQGYDLSYHRAKQVSKKDLEEYDLIIAMDRQNFRDLQKLCTPAQEKKLKLFLPSYAPELNLQDTPDPYYEGGYDKVVSIVEKGVLSLIKEALA
eukprot:TRINITY_DN515_c0_g2_i1.p1 TRINITY_DN515_c0_g2~~TRINITY_DN515_c0_g2_i1.p1  ORF type:complete len:149 (+),score=33.92 TRINITY_DN515_c0_g2_i1:79-525(+)